MLNPGTIYTCPGCSYTLRVRPTGDNVVPNISMLCPACKLFNLGKTVLSIRETQIVRLLTQGHSNKAIAEALCISGKTVESHRQKVYRKLGFISMARLTKYALKMGLTTLDYENIGAIEI